MKRRFFCLILGVLLFVAQGCGDVERKDAVPVELQSKAKMPGLEDVRYRQHNVNQFGKDAQKAYLVEQAYLKSQGHKGRMPTANYLAVSGGGDKGAFGAGLLLGWTAAGNRPEFKVVTGISTGALIAPFAFLGPKYDSQLKEVFTAVSPEDVMKKRDISAIIFKDAMADSRPLWELISKYANQQMMDDIAAEHKKGRMLFVATTDLDARQPVIWNLTKLAASGHPKSIEIFRKIVLASASIPGAFPPVMFEVEINGERYQEMHVDGGAVAQVFIYPPSIDVKKLQKEVDFDRDRKLYIIRNDRLDPDWAHTERQTLKIAERAISSLLHSQGKGDLYTLYLLAKRDDVDYNLAYISPEFKAAHGEEFDTVYMNKLFDFAYEQASKGYPWKKTPPTYVE